MRTVLIAEDDRAVRDSLERALSLEGYTVLTAEDGTEALSQVERHAPDLLLLDVMMPHKDGLEVCRDLRRQGNPIPVLIVTAREEPPHRVAGLDAGADDYMTKPYDIEELLARLRALLRRMPGAQGAELVEAGGVRLDTAGRLAWVGDRSLKLTKTEYDLLELLVRNHGSVMSREQIYEHIWKYDFGPESKNLTVYINYLRAKLEEGGEPRVLETVRGVGYVIR